MVTVFPCVFVTKGQQMPHCTQVWIRMCTVLNLSSFSEAENFNSVSVTYCLHDVLQ